MLSMRKASFLLVAPLAALVGCSIAGDWKLVDIEPEGTEFPLASVNFADDGTYTATSNYAGKTETSSGTYEWTGTKLTVTPRAGAPRTYSGYRRIDNKLVIKHEDEKGKMTGTLEKQG